MILNALRNDYAPLIVIVGDKRSGKSLTALELARRLHNDYQVTSDELNVDETLYYDPHNFIDRMRALSEHYHETGEKVTQGFIMDEAGINLNSKDYYDDFNRAVDGAIQTQGYLNNFYIVVLQKFRDLDKNIREHVNLRILAKKVTQYKTMIGKATKLKYQYDAIDSTEAKIKRVPFPSMIKFDFPPEDYLEAYRDKELSFKHKLLEKYAQDTKSEEEQAWEDAMDSDPFS